MFAPGAIVFQAPAEVKPVLAEHVSHVMICLEQMPTWRFAHAAFTGARQGKFRADKFKGHQLRGFACYNTDLAQKALQYAKQWAAESGVEIATGYSEAQGTLINQLKEQKDYRPEFTADSMRRAFKWAARTDKPLSRIRESPQQKGGVTCPFFVVACYQAAAISLYVDAKDILKLAEEYREVKLSSANVKYRGHAQQVADTQLLAARITGKAPSLAIPKRIVKGADEMLNSMYGLAFFKDILPPSLVLDAKYVSVNWLYQSILQDGENWHPLCDWQEFSETPVTEEGELTS
jgi:hypothetical protein